MVKAILLLTAMYLMLPVARAAYEDPSEAFDLAPEEVEPTGEDVINRRKEKFQRDEIMVYDINQDLGISDRRRWTGDDRNRLAAAFHLNGQYEYLAEAQAIEASYLRRLDNWHKLWVGGLAKRTSGEFRTFATNNPNEERQVPGDEDLSVTSLGLGVGYRFRLLMDFLQTDKTMETVNLFATYNVVDGSDQGQDYRGYGMLAEYGLHRRTRSSFFWGGKFTYNLAWVERSKSDTPQEARSLTLGYYSFALEAGFYF